MQSVSSVGTRSPLRPRPPRDLSAAGMDSIVVGCAVKVRNTLTRALSAAGLAQRDHALSRPAGARLEVRGTSADPAPGPLLPDASRATAFLEARAHVTTARPTTGSIVDSMQFLRVNDVCRLLRISKPTLWRLRRAHDFPEPTDLTDRVVGWRRSDVDSWLSSRARVRARMPTNTMNRSQDGEPTVALRPFEPQRRGPKPRGSRRAKVSRHPGSADQLTLPLDQD